MIVHGKGDEEYCVNIKVEDLEFTFKDNEGISHRAFIYYDKWKALIKFRKYRHNKWCDDNNLPMLKYL